MRMTRTVCLLLTPVAGVQLTQDPLRDVLSRTAAQCSDENTNCYLVDDGALIVYSNLGDKKVHKTVIVSEVIVVVVVSWQ